jgi:hypothetical protein
MNVDGQKKNQELLADHLSLVLQLVAKSSKLAQEKSRTKRRSLLIISQG